MLVTYTATRQYVLKTPHSSILTNSAARENDIIIGSPSYLNRRLDFPEVDTAEQGVAWLKVTPEMGIGLCGIVLGGVVGGLSGLLGLLDHRIIICSDEFMGDLNGSLHDDVLLVIVFVLCELS